MLILTFFTGIAQSDSISYTGFSKKQLYRKLGEPSSIKKNGAKSVILIYETPEVAVHKHDFDNRINSREILQNSERKTFYLNKKGKVYAWKTKTYEAGL